MAEAAAMIRLNRRLECARARARARALAHVTSRYAPTPPPPPLLLLLVQREAAVVAVGSGAADGRICTLLAASKEARFAARAPSTFRVVGSARLTSAARRLKLVAAAFCSQTSAFFTTQFCSKFLRKANTPFALVRRHTRARATIGVDA